MSFIYFVFQSSQDIWLMDKANPKDFVKSRIFQQDINTDYSYFISFILEYFWSLVHPQA